MEISGVKGYDERRQDTASKIVVTQEDIIRYGDPNIGDVLKRLPGVTVGGVQGRGGSIRMRGLGAGCDSTYAPCGCVRDAGYSSSI